MSTYRNFQRKLEGRKISFLGFPQMLKLLQYAPSDEHRKIFATYFTTGCRLYEGAQLEPRMVDFSDKDFIWVSQCVLLKKRDETSTREFPIYLHNPLDPNTPNPFVLKLIQTVNEAQENGCEYLFPKQLPFANGISKTGHASSKYLYQKIREVDTVGVVKVRNPNGIELGLWPHWIRSQSAQYLLDVMRFNSYELKDWFAWSNLAMSEHYVGMSRQHWKDVAFRAEEKTQKML
jgi:hypothetical protein